MAPRGVCPNRLRFSNLVSLRVLLLIIEAVMAKRAHRVYSGVDLHEFVRVFGLLCHADGELVIEG